MTVDWLVRTKSAQDISNYGADFIHYVSENITF